jgi:hypothetical protein
MTSGPVPAPLRLAGSPVCACEGGRVGVGLLIFSCGQTATPVIFVSTEASHTRANYLYPR